MDSDSSPLLSPSPISSPKSSPLTLAEIEEEQPQPNPNPNPNRKKSSLHRSQTAPAIIILPNLVNTNSAPDRTPDPPSSFNFNLVTAAFIFLLYLSLAVLVYSFNPQGYSGIETHPVVDALYFSIVTLCTIGYGDITPLTSFTKGLSCVFVLVGFGIVDVLLNSTVSDFLDVQESIILASVRGGPPAVNYIFDSQKGRMRIRLKVSLAVGAVILSIGAGTLALYYLEGLGWMDSLYLSVMSVTTVGYGDQAFKTLSGRLFASFWLLFSTLAVAKSFLYLAEARINKRHQRIAKWVLHRDLTVEDLYAADIDHNGFICKSEFVIYKLKEMGKISEKDILEIYNQFNKLDPYNTGKITLRY